MMINKSMINYSNSLSYFRVTFGMQTYISYKINFKMKEMIKEIQDLRIKL
jgi:hypothetical protein